MSEKQLFEMKLGNLCNNNCLVCSILDKKLFKNKSLTEIKKELDQFRKQYSELVISGGEPTIREDMIEIIKYAKKLEFYNIILRTNGRMFSYINYCEDVIKMGVDCFQIDLFGHTAELHDSMSRVSGSFDQTVQGIKNLKELNQQVTVNVIITKQNYKQLSKITEFLINLNVDLILLQYINPEGFMNKKNLIRMTSILMNEINKSLDLKSEKYNWDGHIFVKELPIKHNINEIKGKETLDEIKMIKNKFQKNL
jgi:MoaA/NifB/PqqE/SkfB family radical SAM enzyme